MGVLRSRSTVNEPNSRQRRMLRGARERPCHRRAGYGSDEIPPAHAILHPRLSDIFFSKPSRMGGRSKGYTCPLWVISRHLTPTGILTLRVNSRIRPRDACHAVSAPPRDLAGMAAVTAATD